MSEIKFGTDGWRAIVGDTFTLDNVARVTEATANWIKNKNSNASIVIGYDCRFGGKMFAETAALVLASCGVKSILSDRIVGTPNVSLATKEYNADLGIVITASHNPPDYNGFKLKASFGGPLPPDEVSEIEALIPESCNIDFRNLNVQDELFKDLIEIKDIESLYIEKIEETFDLNLIRENSHMFAYDAMFGAGQDVMRKILPEITYLHADKNPGFNGTAPEPIHRNLGEFSELIKSTNIQCGLDTDGDADRIGLYNSKGEFIDSHHIILLLIKYLVEEKNLSGKVVNAFSVSPRIKTMCVHFNLPYQVVKIGFKYVAEIMVKEDVLLGGEESGGIAIKTHLPERDGIWMGLIIWEYMVKSGKSLEDLIEEVYEIVGAFSFERIDLHLKESQKISIMENCEKGNYSNFGSYTIENTEDIDGYKYFFENNQWVMIRPSGTEPVLRTYAESNSSEGAFDILEKTHKTLLSE
jgi:phosphomannomutase